MIQSSRLSVSFRNRASMDDPTVSTYELLKFLLGTESGKKEEDEIRKVIHDARMKSAASPQARIMTINMHGNSKAIGRGTTSDQKLLIEYIMRNFFPCLIFCQEIPGSFEKDVVDKCGIGGFTFEKTENEAAVMWRKEDFDGSAVDTKETFIAKILEKLRKERTDVDTTEVTGRLAMVRLQKIVEGASCPPFLAVSWHGPHKASEEVKSRVFKGLFCFLRAVCEHFEISSCIIGGDFNLDTLEEDLEKNVSVTMYELSGRDQAKILYKDNFFVLTHPFDHYMGEDIWVKWVRPFEFVNSEEPSSDFTKEDHDKVNQQKKTQNKRADLLDHDPIIGILCFGKKTGKFNNDRRTN